ncbi:MAG TPA: M48 family metalloprotease [Bryobacteraceae bacterium]|nr:M48 family metalloprotease [Bryobacteraceae bacterium]
MTPTVTQSVLVYDRIAQNRRKTVFLVAIAILSIVPFIAGLSYLAAQWTLSQLGHHVISSDIDERLQKSLAAQPPPGSVRTEYDSAVEREIEADLAKIHRTRVENEILQWKVTIVFAFGLMGVLGLMFWSLASSPTSQVLAMCGARPAGPAEAEAKRLLENLSIGAGLPVPKLYVIDSPVPNAFAAGMDPSRSVVAVTHGLLALLEHRELEGVLAHEMSHIGNRDTRLNTIVTSIAIFLRLPYLMRQRYLQARRQSTNTWSPAGGRFRVPYTLALAPIYVYVFFIAPVLAAAIRAAISRSREFQADADAALLTRYPEGLLRALAKIRGCGSALPGANGLISHLYFSDPAQVEGLMSLFRGNVLATHPPIETRINRLMEFNGGVPISVLEEAARVGRDFGRDHPALKTPGTADSMGQDELSVLTTGSPMGRVHRLLGDATVYDQPDLKSAPLARLKTGDLVVVFDDPGKFRQILTHNQTFGYMVRSVKLHKMDMLPAEIHDPKTREAAMAKPLPTQETVVAHKDSIAGLTYTQLAITAAFAVVVFAGIFIVLTNFSGN